MGDVRTETTAQTESRVAEATRGRQVMNNSAKLATEETGRGLLRRKGSKARQKKKPGSGDQKKTSTQADQAEIEKTD